jgi:ABC-type transporter Mla maintaining outer membrane lipid asymmetry ATPase subunit MlaF
VLIEREGDQLAGGVAHRASVAQAIGRTPQIPIVDTTVPCSSLRVLGFAHE